MPPPVTYLHCTMSFKHEPLLPVTNPTLSAASRSKLAARRYLPSEKGKGKRRAEEEEEEEEEVEVVDEPVQRGRGVTVIFSNEEGGLEIWVEEGESVGSVKDQVGA
jgi:hypothetical protein